MNDQLVREIVEAVKRDDHGRFAKLDWQCPDCGTKEPVNMEHALVKTACGSRERS